MEIKKKNKIMASEHWISIPVFKVSHPVTTWKMLRRHRSTSIKFASKGDWENTAWATCVKSGFSGLCKILVPVKVLYNNSSAESTQSWLMPCTWRWELAPWNRIQQGDGEVQEDGENQGNEDRALWTSELLWEPKSHFWCLISLQGCQTTSHLQRHLSFQRCLGLLQAQRDRWENISLHELLIRLFTPLKRAPRRLPVARAHGVGDPRLWHLSRPDSEHFMQG